jgi:predicted alpha/beta hydrolase
MNMTDVQPSSSLALQPEQAIIAATDGYPLAASVYAASAAVSSASSSSHVILINSGTGVKRGFYHKFALYLVEHGFTVVTYDYRGVGDSLQGSLRDFNTSMSEWGERDVAGAIDWVFERFGAQTQLSIIGHSAGGKILGFAPNNERVHSLVTISVPNSYWGLRRSPLKFGYALFVHVIMPAMTHFWGYFPARLVGLGEDYPKNVALQWARWSRHEGYIRDPKGGHPHSFDTFTGAVLACSFADDFLAQPRAVESLMNFYTNARERTYLAITPREHGVERVGHSGFFRVTAKPLWKPVMDWLLRQHFS